jgi:LL-diaminopimelate aminotransferase
MAATQRTKRPLTDPSRRLEAVPAYMFAELERRVAEKRKAGIDVISLGIGDPDRPTYPEIVATMQRAVADPANHRYPSNRGREEFRTAFADFYAERFNAEIDAETEVIPAMGAKECIYNLCFAFLDPGDLALAADPGYPVYTGGPALAGAQAALMPLRPELGFAPDLDAIAPEDLERARLMFLNYPNNPTGAIVPDGFFERVIELAGDHEILVVHDNAYSETTYDGYVAPSFLATPGAKDVGVEVFSLSKGFNMTGWRCAAILGNRDAIASYWRLKTNVDSGMFEALQIAATAALTGPRGLIEEMNAIYARRGRAPEGNDLRVGAGSERAHLQIVRRAGPGGGRGGGLSGLDVRPERRGLLPDQPDHPRRPHRRGGQPPA